MERKILLVGDQKLYEISSKVDWEELEELRPVFDDMFDCIKGIRRDYGFGRAIAAPQIGVMKRLICSLTDKPYVIIKPELEFVGDEMIELMDDDMSELIKQEYDHLDGILATMRAIDDKSFVIKKLKISVFSRIKSMGNFQ